ncbi:heavy metal translocating P-type ATPase metal-binding domain-containing protein [Chitinophagaceae bacterium LB-8]|uniref:Heavy metal translocating P-type ATPase metal-binding domain-containing protein n=1 Tax=Paraflavisolibacter caeni TaxID=2982496 RepID=A0A9X2XPV8_9BACT|nr:heavy metal translocating P-type ATPase metal-binding domain-containing protein [Paraflavisolibacter caeni]MCU7551939.1 heavy metal translocating P-type ATPase metal-binding domain-containing protein [Paraflavisolibacter caeni]
MEAIVANTKKPMPVQGIVQCYHCGETCDNSLSDDNHFFCCEGCKFVYGLLKENGLCNYYELSQTPGIKIKGKFATEKFAYLDHADVQQKLIRFTDGTQSHVSFYLPQMHCASCIWLLENLHTIQPGILFSKTNFGRKEIFIAFNPEATSLRKVVELLAFVGYEPYISFNDSEAKKPRKVSRKQIFKIGVAGFCFSNIMMLSFPEYFSSGNITESYLKHIFSYLNLFLALPVFFYCASEFFISAWKGLQQKWLNIDAPIALSILITFSRSVYEVLSGTGAGYFDSMAGIVLFMLAGRWFQNKTYDSFSFDRDYKSYFPLGVTVIKDGKESPVPISALQSDDHIIVRHNEMIPADAVLIKGEGNIDYSFVSGENTPVVKNKGELIYAGARQLSGSIELQVVKTVSQSYITQLWNNNEVFGPQKNKDKSFIHPWSRYFTVVLFSIAASAGIYWWFVNPANILPAVSAALIVACPCSLLLSATFTFGNMLRIFGKNQFYLKNSSIIEALSRINTIVFDKTGTLTHTAKATIEFNGQPLTQAEKSIIYSAVKESAHPLSRMLKKAFLQEETIENLYVENFRELAGKGIEATISNSHIRIGSQTFVTGEQLKAPANGTQVWIAINGQTRGCFQISNSYRQGVKEMARKLNEGKFDLHVLSGDNAAEKENLQQIFGTTAPLQFNQSPQSKLEYIKLLKDQDPASRVLMLGDGLNDAGALRQSDVGVAVSENTSQFTPACDAIMDSTQAGKLHAFLAYARSGKFIVTASFILSILYNIVGLSFAVQALLSPLVAAILMPLSSISIVTFVTIATSVSARKKGL